MLLSTRRALNFTGANIGSNICRYCSDKAASAYERAYKHITKKSVSEIVAERESPPQKHKSIRDYQHVSHFPMPLPQFDELKYEVTRDQFQFVEDYLPPTFKPIPPTKFSKGVESPSGWTAGQN